MNQVDGDSSIDDILRTLNCPIERMQSQEALRSRTPVTVNNADDFAYDRGDIPIFNFDEADRVLIATLQELIEALR